MTPDEVRRYRGLTARQAAAQATVNDLAGERAALLAHWHARGLSYATIAERTGLTRARVQKMVERGRGAHADTSP